MKKLLALFIIILVNTPLYAHNVVGGVYATGALIEGEVGFSNGAMAQAGTAVRVLDESGAQLAEVYTDDQGYFSFTASKRIKHLFEINMGAGHRHAMQLDAQELPASLDGERLDIDAQKASIVQIAQSNTGTSSVTIEQLEIAIAQQIKPLRKEIRALKEKAGLRDIIGGIGYIFGLLGIVALLREHRLKRRERQLKAHK